MAEIIPILRWPRSPIVEEQEDAANLLTGTLIIADDYFDNIIEQLAEGVPLTDRQQELIDTMSQKMLVVQLKASCLLPHSSQIAEKQGV